MKKNFTILFQILAITCYLIYPQKANSQNGPVCDAFSNIQANVITGLGSNYIRRVFVSAHKIFAVTGSGLSISTDGGINYTNKTTADGLGSNGIFDVYVSGDTVVVATNNGVSISYNGGSTFTNKTTTNGLGNNQTRSVGISGGIIYVGTEGGLSLSADGGMTFTNLTTANGLPDNFIYGLCILGNSIYAATNSGLGISTNGGLTFITKNTSHGLGNNLVHNVYALGNNIYAATDEGISISTNSGVSFNNTVLSSQLNRSALGVYAIGSNIFVAGYDGLSISTDGGNTFMPNKKTTDGLGSDFVFGVFACGDTIYAATFNGLSISYNGGTSFTNHTTTRASGLGSNSLWAVKSFGSSIYVCGEGGLSISHDQGTTFTNKSTANGLVNNIVRDVSVSGGTLYVATLTFLSISTDGGITFSHKGDYQGMGSNSVYGVYVNGSTVYAATGGGLSVSTDGGENFTNKTTSDGLGSNLVLSVYYDGGVLYAGTTGGLSISTDNGATFSNKTTANGLGSNTILRVYASGTKIFAATSGGLSISTDGGTTFVNRTTAQGLGNNIVRGIYAIGNTVYAGTDGGLGISTDGGLTFVNKTTLHGLGSNTVRSVFATSNKIYAATSGGLSSCISCSQPTSGGSISSAQSGLTPFDPSAFTSSTEASGHVGSLEYKWQSSTSSSSAGFSDISGATATTYDPGPLTQTTWFRRLARVSCAADWSGAVSSNVLQVTVSKNWIGGTGNWSTPANWSDGVAPVSGDRLTVSSGTPTLDADFTVAGSLTLSGTGGLTIASGVRLTLSGTADFGGRPVTFKSTASGTASLGSVTGTLSNATNVTVERYLPSGRKWRMVTAPLTGSSSNTVFANWQNNDVVSAGTGVEIWGPDGVADPGSGNSGLAIGPNPSMRSYGASGWQNVTNTNSTLLFDNTTNYGFALFAAGPYNNGTSVISPSQSAAATTLSATGTLITGDHTKSMTATSAGQFFLVGNPYASSVDPRSFTTSDPVNRTNLNGKLWMWDAKPGSGIGNGLGRYVSFDLNINQYSVLGNGFADHNVMIQSGQAFFVQATAPGAATLVFREASKNATSTNGMMGDAIDQKAVLRFTLQEQTGTGTENLDGAVAVFHAEGRSGIDPLDGQKLMNTSENLALRREERNLSFEHRPEVAGMDTLRLRIGNMREQEYVLEASGQGFTQTDMKAELVDRLTGVRQSLDPGGITRYRFTVSSESMSTGDRFMVVFGSRNNGSGVTPEGVSGSPELRLFPNPATNRLSVRYAVAAGGSLSLKVYDARGALVMERSVEDRSGAGVLELNTSALPGGLYRVLLTDAAGSNQTQSFIRQ